MKNSCNRPFQKTRLKSVLPQAFLIGILLINFIILHVTPLEPNFEADLMTKRVIEKQARLSFSPSDKTLEKGSDLNKTITFPSVFFEDLDLDEDDLGPLPGWDGKKPYVLTYYSPLSEIRIWLEPARTLDKPPQLI
jgi:hypothetical protein